MFCAAIRQITALSSLKDQKSSMGELTFAMLLDTRPWKLDKSTVRLMYARTMISGVFVSGAVKYNSTTNHNVLIIGLGGGVINNYLSTMPNQRLNITVVDIDPVMKKIAEKWYDFKESELHRIVVEDGIKYAKQASARGEADLSEPVDGAEFYRFL
ncbi:hypothetical protein ANCCEY_08129 [Ancylostoma ceylanicum]|uniref:PABS domain-containing protein n=1 Tax=Ancylostoma ceylanicum TaxID=53326 RepID=A0A0D6LNN0_9BILA|nr:hypothetical protein ANCCEY_08129 [Ancylostoma ceylanicum]